MEEGRVKELNILIEKNKQVLEIFKLERDALLKQKAMDEMNQKFGGTFYKQDYSRDELTKKSIGESKEGVVNMMYTFFKDAATEEFMNGFSFYINGDMNDTIFSVGKYYVDELDKEGYIKISKEEFAEAVQGKMKEFDFSLGINITI